MSGIKKQIDLSGLPKRKYREREVIDWKNAIGCKCRFIYDDIEGEVEIIGYNKGNITVKYDGIIHKMRTDHFKKCLLGKMTAKRTIEFKVNIGEVFKDDKRNIIITDREYRKDEKGVSRKFYKYMCNKCGWTEGWSVESSLLDGSGCACCCNPSKVIVPGINDIPTTAPWMVKYFQGGEEEAKKYTVGSHKKIYPICPDCGRVRDKPIKVYDICKCNSIGCICGCGISYPEKFMYSVLNQLHIDFIYQFNKSHFKWCSKYKYDFYLKDFNIIVETHGGQHYKKDTNFKMSLEEIQINDKIKKELALNNGIDKYIVVDCRESGLEYIKNSILSSELSKSYDLSNIDWNKAHEFALSNLIKKICEYYENNLEITQKEVSKLFKLGKSVVGRYLKQGEKLGWCSNVREKSKNVAIKSGIKLRSKKILCVELNEEFESATECAKQLTKRFNNKFHISGISRVCNDKRKSYQGFTFKYI